MEIKITKQIAKLLIVFSLTSPLSNAWAGLLFNYHALTTKDLDQMNKLVADKIKESKKSSNGRSVPLKEALQAVYSRPNNDAMIEKVAGPLKTQLEDLDVYEKTMKDLTQEAINALKNPKNFKAPVQVTYAYFLENILEQMRSSIQDDGFEKKIIESIAEANVSLSKEALNDRNLGPMRETNSPSAIAKELLAKAKAQAAVPPPPAEPMPSPEVPAPAEPAKKK